MTSTSLNNPDSADLSMQSRADTLYRSLFWYFSLFYCLAWSILCVAFQANFRNDILEQYYIGDQWIFTTAKHPFLFTWFLNFLRLLLFDLPICPYLASGIFTFAMLWGIWQMARYFFQDEKLAFLTVLISTGYRYLMIGNLMFNHDVFQAFCWVLIVLFYYRALIHNKLSSWITLGVWVGLGLYAKYSIVLFLIAIPIFSLLHPSARKYLKSKGPYLSFVIAFLIFLPHLIWLYQHDFITFRYAMTESTHRLRDWYLTQPIPLWLLLPGIFLINVVLCQLLPLLMSLPLTGFPWQWRFRSDIGSTSEDRFRLAFLSTMVFVPILVHALIAASGRSIPTRYVMSIGMYMPLLFLYVLRLRTDMRSLRTTLILGLSVTVISMTAWSGGLAYKARFSSRPSATFFPGKKLAEEVEKTWIEHYGSTPCPYTADMYIYTHPVNVYYYGKMRIPINHPQLTFGITDDEMNRRGGIVLWDMNAFPDYTEETVRQRFSRAKMIDPIVIPYEAPYSKKFRPEKIGIALIPPEGKSE